MKMMIFGNRNLREILRDPINLAFGAAFPVILILLLSLIQSKVPQAIFEINSLAPGMCVFGLSFVSLFSGLLISKDRGSSFLMRLYASPLKPVDFILGYALPLIPLCLVQNILCLAAAVPLGLNVTANLFLVPMVLIPVDLVFIAIGMISGVVFNEKQVGGVCGALLTNLTAWVSGIWIPLDLIGGTFEAVADVLPFAPAVRVVQVTASGQLENLFPDLIIVIAYAIILTGIAILLFKKKMTKDS